jgi:Immunity protein 32
MPIPDHVLSFATDDEGQLFVHADAAGLDDLIRSLTRIRRKLDEGICDHDHLMTASWGGCALSERSLDANARVIHHVKIYGWTPEWIQKLGLAA